VFKGLRYSRITIKYLSIMTILLAMMIIRSQPND